MRLSKAIKPLSFVKANFAKILRNLEAGDGPVIITQNGEAKAVLQDIREYEKTRETLAMLQLIATGRKNVEQGLHRPAEEVFAELRKEFGQGGTRE